MKKAWNELWQPQFSYAGVCAVAAVALVAGDKEFGFLAKLFVALFFCLFLLAIVWTLTLVFNTIGTIYDQWKAGRDYLKNQQP